jgi:hypothetical protein
MPLGANKNFWSAESGKKRLQQQQQTTSSEFYMVSLGGSSIWARSAQSVFPFFQAGIHRFDTDTLEAEYFLKCNNSGINAEIHAMLDYGGTLLIAGNFTTLGNVSINRLGEYSGGTAVSQFASANNNIYDMVKTGGTAAGSTGNLYACGLFTSIDGTNMQRVGKYDGNSWSALGTGLNNSPERIAVDSSENVYVAGGYFTTAGGVTVNRIAKWNGSSWSALGSGLNTNNQVNGLVVHNNGDLYMAGEFTTVSGVSAPYFAKWDGATWTSPASFDAEITSMYYDKNTDDFYFLGPFTSVNGVTVSKVAKWDGATFTNMNDSSVYSPTLPDGILAVANGGGDPHIFKSSSNDIYVAYIPTNQGDVIFAKLEDGTTGWTLFPVSPKRSGGNIPKIHSMVEYDGKLYVGGKMGPCGGLLTGDPSNSHFLIYYDRGTDKFNLNQVGAGNHIDHGSNGFWWDAHRERLIHYGGLENLDPDNVGTRERGHYWKNTEQEWEEFIQTNASVPKPARIGEYLYIAGGNSNDMLGNRIAKYDDVSDVYSSIGFMNSTVWALATDGTVLFAGGDFTTAGGVTVNRIATYNGSSWSNFEGTTGANNSVECLVYATGDSVSDLLYAGGEFTSMQGLANTRGIAAYSPTTRAWEDVGGGLGNGEVNAMDWDPENEILYIAGNFTNVGGQTIRYLAKWDGLTWSDVGGSDAMFSSFAYVRSDRFGPTHFDTYSGKLFVIGQFVGEDANTGKAYINVMIWDGVSWDNFARYEGSDGHTGVGIHFAAENLYPIPFESGLTFPVYSV